MSDVGQELWPHDLGNTPLTELEYVADLSRAAKALRLLRNRQADVTGLSPQQIAARQQILDIATGLCVSTRNETLDAFAKAWIAYRKEHADGS
jgi:hypothetical protein